ncbi:putative long-chain-fatty-acid CoA ligase 5 [Onchocerca flexuosa]|uniref:long-chain-fatty-acid--CoA ligase n=2 Tax=Onchocerca flexuosa TaxID=387005 RepID=A0A238BIR8_9BILA|nr:putative long-chain-fatty-acid CoA ligase 5 [Onchocerca flexuosa]
MPTNYQKIPTKLSCYQAYSRVIPGPERIHESILIRENELLEYPPDGNVTTMFELLQRAIWLTDNGDFIGEQTKNGTYKWMTYKQVYTASHKIGSALLQLGIDAGEGSRIGIAGLNSARYIIAQNALINYSIVLVPLYHNYNMEFLCAIIDHCKLELIFCDTVERANKFIAEIERKKLKALKKIIIFNDSKEKIDREFSKHSEIQVYNWDYILELGEIHLKPVTPPSPSNIYIICHTSGTTGTPKGVQLSHRAILVSMSGLYVQWCLPPHDIVFDHNDLYLSFLPLAHVYEQLLEAFIIYIGGRIGIFGGDPKRLIHDMRLLRPTIAAFVPRLLNRYHDMVMEKVNKQNIVKRFIFYIALRSKLRQLAKGQLQFNTIWDKIAFKKIRTLFGGQLRLITSGGAPISINVMNFSRIVYGCLLIEGYGQTECSAAGTITLPFDTVGGHVGGPAAWAQIKLVDAKELGYSAEENTGEVCFRGAGLMDGYFNDPELTSQRVDQEGWLHTGDIGMWLPNGSLRIIDRRNNLFKLAHADFVSPEQIENVYSQHPLVKQIFIYGSSMHEYLIAIVVVDAEKLYVDMRKSNKEAMFQLGTFSMKSQLSMKEFLSDRNVRRYFLTKLRKFGCKEGLSSIEQVKNVYLLEEEFTVEAGLMTPTLKIVRMKLRDKFKDILDEMYSEELDANLMLS